MWIKEYLPKLNVKVCQGIGGTLDAITGETKRAPRQFFRSFRLNGFIDLLSIPKESAARPLSLTFSLKSSHKNASPTPHKNPLPIPAQSTFG
jgi:N-acetylglucosaminyldiphosphoundecaprenol N-acetyl-beta-D-mannosaminyltransferase